MASCLSYDRGSSNGARMLQAESGVSQSGITIPLSNYIEYFYSPIPPVPQNAVRMHTLDSHPSSCEESLWIDTITDNSRPFVLRGFSIQHQASL